MIVLARAGRTIQFSGALFFGTSSEEIETLWGCSSVGRAVALQAIGQEFDSPQLHQINTGV
jgi:hypothetical protein